MSVWSQLFRFYIPPFLDAFSVFLTFLILVLGLEGSKSSLNHFFIKRISLSLKNT